MKRLLITGCCLLAAVCLAGYTLTFTPPLPADTNGTLIGYQGFWQYTNSVPTNAWYFFGGVNTGMTRISIPVYVGSPAWLVIRSLGTNGALSTNLTLILYNTNALAGAFTNNPLIIPPAPSTLAITNN